MIYNLRLQHFRSYTDESFEIEPGVNIIVGPNASGKTNLLEAILLLCRGNSYRARDTELVQHDAPWARIDALTDTEQRTIKFHIEPSGVVRKEFVINEQSLRRLSHQKTWPVVLFEPNHLQLLTGSPELRRDYLDQLLDQLYPGFGATRRQYKRALAQRNALLKGDTRGFSQLFAWNVRLSTLGGQIADQRLQLVAELNKQLGTTYSKLAHHTFKAEINYLGTCPAKNYGSELLHKLEKSTELDQQRGFTAYGPHRDDWMIELGGRAAEQTASRGETRTLLLALKLLELQIVESTRNKKPILLLDDVFSELDGARRMALTEVLKTHQTFITTTDADVVVQHFLDQCNIIPTTAQ
jgi:DNA replication and repair protein RecF